MSQFCIRIESQEQGHVFTNTAGIFHHFEGALLTGRGVEPVFDVIEKKVGEKDLKGFDAIADSLGSICYESLFEFVHDTFDFPGNITFDQFLEFAWNQEGNDFMKLSVFVVGYSEKNQAMSLAACLSYPGQGGVKPFQVRGITEPGFIFFTHMPTVERYTEDLGRAPESKEEMLECLGRVYAHERQQMDPKSPYCQLMLGQGQVVCTSIFKDGSTSKETFGPLAIDQTPVAG